MKFDQLRGIFMYNQNLKINVTDKLIYETETNSQTWRTDMRLPKAGAAARCGLICKRVCTEWASSKMLLHSTGSSIQ